MARKRFNKKNSPSSKTDSKVYTTPHSNLKEAEKQFQADNAPKEESPSSTSGSTNSRKSNDPSWYMESPEQVNAVAKVAFSEPLGEILPIVPEPHVENVNDTRTVINKLSVGGIPGVLVLRTKPTFGYSFNITDPLNVSATELYVHVRYQNNGRKNYDASDLMIHTLAIADLYSLVMYIKKVYAAAFEYSNRNYYLGKVLLRALGFDPKDIVSNLANLRYWLNTFINKLGAYVVPGSINLFKRRAFLYADVYTESLQESIKDQMYTFMPDGFFKFDFDDSEGGLGAGMLKYVSWPGGKDHAMTYSELIDFAEDLFSNITQDEDFGLMSGDILKAFGNDIITVTPLDGEYYLDVHYDHQVLHQIMNSTINGTYAGKWSDNHVAQPRFAYYENGTMLDIMYECGNVYQNPKGVLITANIMPGEYVEGMSYRWLEAYRNVLLNTDTVDVTVDEVMEMTRLTTSAVSLPTGWASPDLGPDKPTLVLSCGSDIVVAAYVVTMDGAHNVEMQGSNMSMYELITGTVVHDLTTEVPFSEDSIKRATWQTQFKYAPQLIEWRKRLFQPDPAMPAQIIYHVENILQNLENYTFISKEQLDRIHKVAMYSLVHVPGVTKLLNS